MSQQRTGSRLSHGGAQYLLETDPGALIYRNGSSTTNLQQRQWTDVKQSDSAGGVSFTLPVGLFSAVHFVDFNVVRDTANPQLATFCMVRSATTTTVTGQCFESKTSGVLLGGVIEGLEATAGQVLVMIRVTGI